MRLIPVLIGVLSLIMVALVGVLVFVVLPGSGPGETGDAPVTEDSYTGGSVDNQARIDLELMRGDIENLQIQIAQLEQRLNQAAADSAGGFQDGGSGETLNTGPNEIIDQYSQVVLVADRRQINQGLFVATPSYLIEKLGMPREDLNDNCQQMTNPRLVDKLVTEPVGPIKVQMLRPAVESLRRVFDNIQTTDKDLYDRINTAGSLCVRRIRGSANSVSTHSFGLAVDLNIDGVLDTLGDGKTQLGLTILADFFNTEGWVWGAAFSREDSMHFEISKKQLDEWIAAGLL